MQNRPRAILLLCLLAVLTFAGAGCGGGGEAASDDTSVDELLDKTFSGEKKVDSGRLDLALRLDVQGGSASQLQGPVSLELGGPFQSQGEGKLPQFDIDASFEGGGQKLAAGLTSTGDKGFVSFNGTDYAVSDQVFQQFRTGYEQAQKQAQGQNSQQQQSLATLGIDPRRWLTNGQNAGEEKVGDTDTIKITGDVDVARLLDDVNRALEEARSLGVQGADGLPEKLTDEQKRQAAEAIKDLKVEIYTGKEDTTLRRMLVSMNVAPPSGESGSLSLDFSLLDLNEKQEIQAPSGAKPFDDLLGQLGNLGIGGLGGAPGSGSGSGGGGGSGSSSGNGASAEALKKYSACIEKAGNDTAKVQQCAELLSP